MIDRKDSTFILNKMINIKIMELSTKGSLNYRERKTLERLVEESSFNDHAAKA